jgi:hypothetical protein
VQTRLQAALLLGLCRLSAFSFSERFCKETKCGCTAMR